MSFDAVSIEYAFAQLIGNQIGGRGTVHDADVFRGGKPASLAKAVEAAADALQAKTNAKSFSETDSEPGGAKARIDVAISRLRATAKSMSTLEKDECEDYHWEIVGALVATSAALLEKLT
jgi:hypothetical protein